MTPMFLMLRHSIGDGLRILVISKGELATQIGDECSIFEVQRSLEVERGDELVICLLVSLGIDHIGVAPVGVLAIGSV